MKRSTEEIQAFCEVRAEEMKRSPTKAEAAMWAILEPKSVDYNQGWVNQLVLNDRTKNGGEHTDILDFAYLDESHVPVLCIEVDGGYHRQRKGPDERRERRLTLLGIRTIRFTNNEVLKHPDQVRAKVTQILEDVE